MKKISVFMALLCLVFTSCEKNYEVTHKFFLDNNTSESLIMTYTKGGKKSSKYAIPPYGKFDINQDQFLNEKQTSGLNSGNLDSMTIEYKGVVYEFASEDENSPADESNYIHEPYFTESSIYPTVTSCYLFTLDEEFFTSLK